MEGGKGVIGEGREKKGEKFLDSVPPLRYKRLSWRWNRSFRDGGWGRKTLAWCGIGWRRSRPGTARGYLGNCADAGTGATGPAG